MHFERSFLYLTVEEQQIHLPLPSHLNFHIFHLISVYTGMSLHAGKPIYSFEGSLINSIHMFIAPLENSIALSMHRNLQFSIALLTEEIST